MNKAVLRSFIGMIILIVIIFLFMMLHTEQKSVGVTTLESLQTYVVGGSIFDADGSIGVTDYHDINVDWKSNGGMHLSFGKIKMDFTKKELEDSHVIELLGNLGLTISKGNLYYGEELIED